MNLCVKCEQLGIRLAVDGDKLDIAYSKRNILGNQLLDELKEHKWEIMALIQNPPPRECIRCRACCWVSVPTFPYWKNGCDQ